MRGAIPLLHNTPSWRGAQFKHRDNFTFTFENKPTRFVARNTVHRYLNNLIYCNIINLNLELTEALSTILRSSFGKTAIEKFYK
jgi:hypothetical protein